MRRRHSTSPPGPRLPDPRPASQHRIKSANRHVKTTTPQRLCGRDLVAWLLQRTAPGKAAQTPPSTAHVCCPSPSLPFGHPAAQQQPIYPVHRALLPLPIPWHRPALSCSGIAFESLWHVCLRRTGTLDLHVQPGCRQSAVACLIKLHVQRDERGEQQTETLKHACLVCKLQRSGRSKSPLINQPICFPFRMIWHSELAGAARLVEHVHGPVLDCANSPGPAGEIWADHAATPLSVYTTLPAHRLCGRCFSVRPRSGESRHDSDNRRGSLCSVTTAS